MKSEQRKALGEILLQAVDAPGKGAYVPATAADLRAFGAELKGRARGRPSDPSAKEALLRMAREYYDLRIRGYGCNEAIAIVLHKRHDGSMYEHDERRWRAPKSLLRELRGPLREEALRFLDLLSVTPEEVAALRKQLKEKSLPKPRRDTRK